MTLLAMLHAGLVLPTAFGPRSAADGRQRSLPAPMPGFDAPPARALPRPFEEELESINQEKGIQSRWITDQKQTLEKEITDLEDEREGLMKQV